MGERILTKEEHILVLETRISERALIAYVVESAILDNEESQDFPLGYVTALEDELENHKITIEEYQEELKQLQK